MPAKKVVITGLGALSACGNTVQATWEAILAGKTGIDLIKQWDLSSWAHRLGGELKDFQPAKMLPDRKLLKLISRQDVLGIYAAMQAIEHSALIPYRDSLQEKSQAEFNDRTAIYVASPGNKYYQQDDFLPLLAKTGGQMQPFAAELFNEVHPMWLLRILPNNVLAYTGITYGFKGPNHNIANHATGGVQAILEAKHAISQGQADRAVVIAYDVAIEPQALYYYKELGLISKRHLNPFDETHDGTILAEGAAALVLESEEAALERGALCFAAVEGGMARSEGAGLFSLELEGQLLAQLLDASLKNLSLLPHDIDFIVAHGNGNIKSDETEAKAITTLFKNVPITAFKWAFGHTICASGLLDAVLMSYALKQKCLPGMALLKKKARLCENLNLSAAHRSLDEAKQAIMISRGFGSMNACLVLKACD